MSTLTNKVRQRTVQSNTPLLIHFGVPAIAVLLMLLASLGYYGRGLAPAGVVRREPRAVDWPWYWTFAHRSPVIVSGDVSGSSPCRASPAVMLDCLPGKLQAIVP